jgi:hypothetical protein
LPRATTLHDFSHHGNGLLAVGSALLGLEAFTLDLVAPNLVWVGGVAELQCRRYRALLRCGFWVAGASLIPAHEAAE